MRVLISAAVVAGAGALVALSALGLRRRFLVVTVAGISMKPTLHSGDRVLVRRAGIRRVRKGDIIVLGPAAGTPEHQATGREPAWIIKRAVALPGDPIPAVVAHAFDGAPRDRVPSGKLVLLGDNPESSNDSRQTGYFDGRRLVGRVVRQISSARPGRVL